MATLRGESMNEVKRFEGKNVETAIQKACSYFGKNREELEVEIIDTGSSGIFGLGGRNSIIEAKPKDDSQELEELVRNVVERLLGSMIEDPKMNIHINERRIHVIIDDVSNSGLVIGKEGQTISALEYIANRIIAKNWPEKVYIQLDAGGYRHKQEESVKQNALYLAEKVKKSGKTQSTKPLSSYYRRLVHTTLKNEKEIVTRSRGEGPMKRVLIQKKKSNQKPKGNSR